MATYKGKPDTVAVLVRIPLDMLAQVRAAAGADDRPMTSWIRRAIQAALDSNPAQ